ncbi:hypothetical protein COLO4_28797 [Corchorus olitorius]|uniref:Uncharacterized protein n=1 Tax=Corchorus olitorius TaxID=93759 RepID=A0A1R3HIC2_9ROSI|nr:hypothetical protein COLO4_28797 [Corchorus olitorius]
MKGFYFPHCSLLDASKSKLSSWAWKSLHEGIELLRMGTRWNVSNGNDILIWQDKWVLDLLSKSLSPPPMDHDSPRLVKHFINFNNWNKLVWHFTKGSSYSVKSGYRMLMNSYSCSPFIGSSRADNNHSATWKKQWRLNAPPKIKNFIWRACRNVVATKENLSRRHHVQDAECHRCDEEVESLEHIIFFCPFAQAVCNLSLFEGVVSDPIHVWNAAFQCFIGYVNGLEDESTTIPNNVFAPSQWQSPPVEVIKINCDASYCSKGSFAGLAVVCRNSNGVIIDGASLLEKAASVHAAEAFAIRLAVQLARDKGWRHIIVESDNLALINCLKNSKAEGYWESWAIVEDINLSLFHSFSFSFIHRQGNRVTNWVAKKTRTRDCPLDWMHSPPDDLVGLLSNY